MSLTEKTTHEAEALATLLHQFQGKSNLAALISAYVVEIQEAEAVAFDVLASREIDTAEGVQLDLLGQIIGQARQGQSDAVYRLWLKARVRVNVSSGTPEDLLAVAILIVSGGVTRVAITENYPASFLVEVADALTEDPNALAAILREARAAGVHGAFLYSLVDDDLTFTFSSGDTEEASNDQGWAAEKLTNGDFTAWSGGNPTSWNVTETLPNYEVSEVASGASHGGGGSGACNVYAAATVNDVFLGQAVTGMVGVELEIHVEVSALAGSAWVLILDYGAGAVTKAQALVSGSQSFTYTPQGTIEVYLSNSPDLATRSACDVTVDRVEVYRGGQFAAVLEA